MNTILLIALLSMVGCVKICLYIAIMYYFGTNKTIPTYLLNLSYNLSYNSIYYYSKLQLGFIKTQNTLTRYAKSVPFLNNLLTYMKPDNTIYTYTTINENLTICSKFNEAQNLDYKIILHYKPDYEKIFYIESLELEQADYKFIMTEISIDDKKFVVHFTSDKYNYLIVNNKLDNNFINYFLKTHYNEFVKDLEIENYIIKIIDHNVNILEFDNTKTLLINKTGYEIL
jgi:hypothetical protein